MALLTAEDVLNKAFSKTKYREGFDQDEVDDFLDEVANTIAALTAERDDFAARLSQVQGGAPAPAPAAPAAPAPSGMTTADSLLAAATNPNPPSATTMLAMAQKLHDEYVQAGEAEKERILDDARGKAESIMARAEQDAKERMGSLEAERAELERTIDDLRRFERDYRGHLKNYLENLLGDLEHGSSKGPSSGGTATQGIAREQAPQQSPPQQSAPPRAAPQEPTPSAPTSGWPVLDAPVQREQQSGTSGYVPTDPRY